jgi:hypothetical protein
LINLLLWQNPNLVLGFFGFVFKKTGTPKKYPPLFSFRASKDPLKPEPFNSPTKGRYF